MKEKLAEERAKQEEELKRKMLEMKKEGKSVEEIKAYVLAEKKKAAAAALQSTMDSSQEVSQTLTLEDLKKRPKECDNSKLESYLSDKDFKQCFGCTKPEFTKLPGWKKVELKKKLGLH